MTYPGGISDRTADRRHRDARLRLSEGGQAGACCTTFSGRAERGRLALPGPAPR